jgi:hypothetical protein
MYGIFGKPSKRAFQTCMGHGGVGAFKKKLFKAERGRVCDFWPFSQKSGPWQATAGATTSKARGWHEAWYKPKEEQTYCWLDWLLLALGWLGGLMVMSSHPPQTGELAHPSVALQAWARQ